MILPLFRFKWGRIVPLCVSRSVNVIDLLCLKLVREIYFSPFPTIITLSVATYLDSVWSPFIINSPGMLKNSTLSEISWRNCDLVSFHKECVITGHDVVSARRENFILWYKDLIQERETWKLRCLANFGAFDCTNPIRAPLKTCLFIPAPAVWRYTIIERSFKSHWASRNIGLLRVCPIFKVVFSFFAFFFSFNSPCTFWVKVEQVFHLNCEICV